MTLLAIENNKTDMAGNIVRAFLIGTQPKKIRPPSGQKRWEYLWVT